MIVYYNTVYDCDYILSSIFKLFGLFVFIGLGLNDQGQWMRSIV